MREIVTALLAGLVFGIGLTVSGMVDPAKVLGFLDIAGAWDPSLALVMAGGVVTALVGFRLARRQARPLFASAFPADAEPIIDGRLLGGAALFGLGWGLVGLCPGPAVSALVLASHPAAIFFASMIVGMLVWRQIAKRSGR